MSEFNNKEDLFAFLSEDEKEVDLPIYEDVLEDVALELDQVEEQVVVVPEEVKETTVVESVENNVVGTATKTSKPAKVGKSKATEVPGRKDKVAIHSSKNATWSTVGTVYRGFNIVTPEVAEKWLERNHIRMATPEEVAKEFGL